MRRFPTTASLLSFALLLTACGGGGGEAPGMPEPVKGTTTSPVGASATGSGVVWGSGTVETAPGKRFVGEVVNEARGFFTFFLGAIQNREVVSCTLRLAPDGTLGNPTDVPINGYVAERVSIGTDLDMFDFSAPALGAPSPNGPNVIPSAGTGGYFELDVAPALRAALAAGQSSITLRLRIAGTSDMDGFPDGFYFSIAEPAHPALNPVLMLELRDL